MKLYISADIEGIAGVVSRDQGSPEGFEYENGRKWMTGEVSAACKGAFETGVTDIVISDSHGNGQNLLLDDLPEQVRVVRSWPRPLDMMQGIEEGNFDAALLIGYHAGSTHIGGMMAHTLYGKVIKEVRINEQVASETLISAAIAGHFDVPVIFISGDDEYVKETKGLLTDFESVVTKTSYSTLCGNTLTPSRSRTLIREGVAKALNRMGDFKALTIAAPITLQVDFKHRLPAEILDFLPIVKRISAYGIEYQASDMLDTSRFLSFINQYEPTLI
ncbi:MAG: M55 family metallopeptidase [Gammaproteobacteria bacterium]|nr:M55 family metallopeptidase [Gammaproteobacteria bacterium]